MRWRSVRCRTVLLRIHWLQIHCRWGIQCPWRAMLLPMAIFGLINWLISFEIATATIAVMGFIGIALHKKLMAAITKKYIANKYVMIHSFNQEN